VVYFYAPGRGGENAETFLTGFDGILQIDGYTGYSSFAFPRYNKTTTTNANSASAALNKWMKPFVPDGCSMHSFRHSMRDRLRALQCPADIVDQIGGWQTNGVGHGYGEGYPLHVLNEWLTKLSIGK
jgi:integrase